MVNQSFAHSANLLSTNYESGIMVNMEVYIKIHSQSYEVDK